MEEKSLLKMLDDERYLVSIINSRREDIEKYFTQTDMLDNPYLMKLCEERKVELLEFETKLYQLRSEIKNYFTEVIGLRTIDM